ncbi:MAG: [FeFe] hydrogenase H-cluster radical SAM maturase HydE [Parasporobacterium sp.]|nr:[FeFe] hydrogenase H-cluster radical SAM maturase HydE [Parasporobacterium sp.]
MTNFELTDKLKKNRRLEDHEYAQLLTTLAEKEAEYLYKSAAETAVSVYGKDVYIRGLIEISNYCRNDCYYCGIRRSNRCAERYRLTKEQILECCRRGYELGFRTFVLQGGEDGHFTDRLICDIVSSIKRQHPDCAVTLSLGEKTRASYQAYFDAGADRYLLRHETADPEHYAMLHPEELSCENRKRCLYDLKDIGYQVGCGIMVGSPFQTTEHIIEDLKFMKEFEPHMVGIGPFIPHKDTPFRDKPPGTLKDTLHLLAIIRLMLPNVLLPATTALGTIDLLGREKGIAAGANVIMPNLSPMEAKKKYILYNGKISTGDEAAEAVQNLKKRVSDIGYRVIQARGDHISV